MARAMAQSPDAPKDYLALLEALSKGFLDKKLAAEIALSLAGLHFNPNRSQKLPGQASWISLAVDLA